MKPLSATLQSHLQGDRTTLATCWKLTRSDGLQQGFTDCDRPFIFENLTYHAVTGFNQTTFQSSATLNPEKMVIEGILSSDALNEADIIAGIYDFAEIEVFYVNYNDLSQGIVSVCTGTLGRIAWDGEHFVTKVHGLKDSLTHTIGQLYSPTCRATLGDGNCKVNLANISVNGSITTILSPLVFIDNSRNELAETFTNGVLKFLTGANSGLTMEVKSYNNSQLTLCLPMPYLLQLGDNYILTPGCDKLYKTCKTRFYNTINFRGEPHIPGIDRMLETATTRKT